MASTTTSSSKEDIKSSSLPKTHYEFFPETLSKGPPPTGRFLIDLRKLRKEFLQLQAVAHPDRHPSSLKTRAEATSARINEAYKTLQNPLLRAQYLLSLRGMDVSEDETAKVDDPEFLMEVMDIREGIENSRDEKVIQDTRAENEQRISVSENILDDAFAREDLVTAQAEAVRLRYWVNIQESLGEWEEKMINETINSDEK
ncbi:hypothetical protein B0O99DRAFT_217215 [Bisporella sp. PMI_857]|nr:hypothetical protein B0O99DRAFT_217215 [Bisporella sp. PMI_857]